MPFLIGLISLTIFAFENLVLASKTDTWPVFASQVFVRVGINQNFPLHEYIQ